MTPTFFSKPVKIKGIFTLSVNVDFGIDARAEYLGFNYAIHTKYQLQHERTLVSKLRRVLDRFKSVNSSVNAYAQCEHGLRQKPGCDQ